MERSLADSEEGLLVVESWDPKAND